MNYDEYMEVINGEDTYKVIADTLKAHGTIGIGWNDEECTHLDIVFKLGLDTKVGNFQRGIQRNDLFVSIIDHTSYGFKTDNIKLGTYIQERLRINNSCGDKLAELINGIISELGNDNDEC